MTILKKLSASVLEKIQKTAQPAFVKPMLATLTKDYFSDKGWFYEHKFDGERCLAFKKNGVVKLMSRNRRNINAEYPELVEALTKQKADNFIIDGEIVAHAKKGQSDFELLQGRINLRDLTNVQHKQKAIKIDYCIFDLIYVDGSDIRHMPLYARKERLKKLLSYKKPLVYTTHKVGNGIPFFKKACKLHWEGLIAKDKMSTYVGRRSTSWLKFKCIMQQELVIGGYTEPQGSRINFGALLVGYYKGNKFIFAGKVGTGFDQDALALLGKKLRKIPTSKCPFTNYTGTELTVHWVRPLLVAEFEFAEWTASKRLRVGRYKGLRTDKKARDVVRETPKRIGPRKKAAQ